MEKTLYERLIPSLKARSIINRLVKAFIFGALGALAGLTIIVPKNWADFATIIPMIIFACISGGFTGVMMALQKFTSWVDVE